MNILIPNIGRKSYLVDFIKKTDFGGKVYVSDCDVTAAALYSDCDEFFILPKPVNDEKKYIDELLNLCWKKDINIIIPVIDPEVDILSRYREVFSQHGIMVPVSSPKVLEICFNKIKMNEFLESKLFSVIKTFTAINAFRSAHEQGQISFPVFIKPVLGSGSIDSTVVHSIEHLMVLFREGMIIQEYLVGEEYGVDIFNDEFLQPVRIVIKRKLSMRSGETDKAITVIDAGILKEMKRLAQELGHFGPLDCDLLKTKDKIFILDLNPRLGGGYPATHMAGVNFVDLMIKLFKRQSIPEQFDNYVINQLTMKDIGIRTVHQSE